MLIQTAYLLATALDNLAALWFTRRFSGQSSARGRWILAFACGFVLTVATGWLPPPPLQWSWALPLGIVAGCAFLFALYRLLLGLPARLALAAAMLVTLAQALTDIAFTCLLAILPLRAISEARALLLSCALTLLAPLLRALTLILFLRYRPQPMLEARSLALALSPIFLLLLTLRAQVAAQLEIQLEAGAFTFRFGAFASPSAAGQALLFTLLALACAVLGLLSAGRLMHALALDQRAAQMEKQMALQREAAQQAQQRDQLTRAFRHDLKNHLTVLRGLLDAGETGQALSYLGRLQQTSQLVSPSVKTGCPALDCLLAEKLAAADRLHIQSKCQIRVPSCLWDKDLELCTLLGNALDNATHACQAMTEGRRYVDIQGKQSQAFFVVDVVNSRQADAPGTGGKAGRGLGQEIMGKVCGQMGGLLRVQALEDRYILTILLPLAPDGAHLPPPAGEG